MPQQTQQPPGVFQDVKESLNWLYIIVNVYAMCFLPNVRCRWGIEGFGVAGGLALIVLMLMTYDPILKLYLGIWLLAVLLRRIEAWALYRKGEPIHSQYQGDSELKMLPDVVAKMIGEPILVGIAGAILMRWSQPAGMFFGYGAIAVFAKALIERTMIRRQMRQLRDNEIAMRNYSGMYREHGGGW